MKKKSITLFGMTLLFGMVLLFSGCATYSTQVDNTSGRPSVYVQNDSTGPIAGIGIESQDIIGMTDKMMRDMFTYPILTNAGSPPHVIIDSQYFKNESSSRINLNMITDRLRIGLNRNARGRMIFVGRHFSDMVEKEKKLKSQGVVGGGTTPHASKTLGGDYLLGGRITSQDAIQQSTGLTSRSTYIMFEMVDLQTGQIVWGGDYSFKKAAADDVIYR
ncbi:hypothetical protein QUF90_12240 [Desulfococcaceae bacterium HSG9]|nr:hypothetical protein [Desulfococcaceae bacterium HSG9]